MSRLGSRWGVPPAAQRDRAGDRAGDGAGDGAGGEAEPHGLASGAVVADPPTLFAGVRAEPGVRVDRARVADEGQHREVVVGVGVRRAAPQVEPLPGGQRLDRLRLGRAVQQVADESAGVDAVHVLGDRPERPGQAQAAGDDAGDLDRRRGDQPDALALVEVQLRERAGARPDPVRHAFVEDLLAELLELGHGVPGDEAQRRGPGLGDVRGVLDAQEPEVRLLVRSAEDVARGEEVALVEASGEVEDAGALHHGVVDVEERGRVRVRGQQQRRLDLGSGGGSLARQPGPRPQVEGSGSPLRGRHIRRVDPRPGRAPCGSIAPMPAIRDVAELVASAAAESPDRLALVEAGGRSLTWAELEDQVGRLATGLAAAGVLGGHRVMLAQGNRLEFVTTYLGVLRAQAVAVPVNPGSAVGELARMLEDSGSRLVVADATTAAAVREAAGGLAAPPRVVVVGEESYDELRAAPARPVP